MDKNRGYPSRHCSVNLKGEIKDARGNDLRTIFALEVKEKLLRLTLQS
jgi:hypothetical protein